MKMLALRTVYSRSEGKEYQKGQVFEASEREARVFVKLRKAEAVEKETAPAPKSASRQPPAPAQRTLTTTAMKAEEQSAAQTPAAAAESPRSYRRRDLRPEE